MAGAAQLEADAGADQARYWRGEILAVLCWLRGEGLCQVVDAPALERFLGLDTAAGARHLEGLARDGLLARVGSGYTLGDGGRLCPACTPPAEWADHVP
ncbi:MAG TPA: hypothetical protein VE760_02770 [Acidimicrobiales bacterium]|jgi:hypothetical protein|nr:hypothetical protein [Acidimicrobiales bacterium]